MTNHKLFGEYMTGERYPFDLDAFAARNVNKEYVINGDSLGDVPFISSAPFRQIRGGSSRRSFPINKPESVSSRLYSPGKRNARFKRLNAYGARSTVEYLRSETHSIRPGHSRPETETESGTLENFARARIRPPRREMHSVLFRARSRSSPRPAVVEGARSI